MPRLVALAKKGAFDGVDVTAVATGTNPGYPNYPPSSWLEKVNWPYKVLAEIDMSKRANYQLRASNSDPSLTAGEEHKQLAP